MQAREAAEWFQHLADEDRAEDIGVNAATENEELAALAERHESEALESGFGILVECETYLCDLRERIRDSYESRD